MVGGQQSCPETVVTVTECGYRLAGMNFRLAGARRPELTREHASQWYRSRSPGVASRRYRVADIALTRRLNGGALLMAPGGHL
jgi:hypothetical protein